jgi:cyclophilin family peptidyl-prolyl cis-trans isomerase
MSRSAGTYAIFETSEGNIVCRLFEKDAPKTVANFVELAEGKREWTHPSTRKKSKDRLYDGTIFHRVIPDFMIQGGGFAAGMKEKKTKAAIQNESANGLSNKRGTLAMARTSSPDSATAQFFINVKDNDFLDKAKAGDKVGYCVFGKVTAGLDVVDKIKSVKTASRGSFQDVPVQEVTINSIRRA